MSNTYLGLDIGESSMKLASVRDGRVLKLSTRGVPDHLMKDGRPISEDALSEELRAALKEGRLGTRNCALVLPPECGFVRRVTMPYMTVEQLRVNLPYEFHDYIQKDKDQYYYDYAVAGVRKDESGEPRELDLLAAASPKEVIGAYRTVLRRAGLTLKLAVPEYLTYRNLIRVYEASHTGQHPREYCVVDMGHSAIRAHMYRGGVYETSRVIEYGGVSLDALIADSDLVDPHVASGYKRANYEGAQEIPACRELYTKIAVEILRAVNFYGFNTPESDLRDIYIGGGLAKIRALMETIRSTLTELNIHPVEELLPPTSDEQAALCPAAVGAALEMGER